MQRTDKSNSRKKAASRIKPLKQNELLHKLIDRFGKLYYFIALNQRIDNLEQKGDYIL